MSNDKNNHMGAKIAAGAAVVGAAVVAAAALSDEDTRNKIGKGLKVAGENIKEKGSEALANLNQMKNVSLQKLKVEFEQLRSDIEAAAKDFQKSKEFKKLQKDSEELKTKIDEAMTDESDDVKEL